MLGLCGFVCLSPRYEFLKPPKDTLRGLVDRIVLTPTEPDGKLSVHLHGALAKLLSLSLSVKRKKGLSDKTQAIDNVIELVLVEGGRYCRNLPCLICAI